MSSEHVWGAPDGQPRWGRHETVAALGVAVVIAGLGGAAIFAATDTGASRGGPGAHQFGPPPGGFGGPSPGGPGAQGPGSFGGFGATSAAPLHSEAVVRDGGGGYTTRLTQTGVVTATTPTTMTVRSADDFTQTWTVPADAPTSPVGAQVSVEGTREGADAAANRISPSDR